MNARPQPRAAPWQAAISTRRSGLERAHILGQPWAGPHSWAHWQMLKIGWRRKDGREVRGQLIRLAAGGLLSWMGRLPSGNTGGANVPAEQPMPLPDDLADLCR